MAKKIIKFGNQATENYRLISLKADLFGLYMSHSHRHDELFLINSVSQQMFNLVVVFFFHPPLNSTEMKRYAHDFRIMSFFPCSLSFVEQILLYH